MSENFDFTKRRIAADRKSTWLRIAMVLCATALGAAVGFSWPDATSVLGAMRVGIFSAAAALLTMYLTRRLP